MKNSSILQKKKKKDKRRKVVDDSKTIVQRVCIRGVSEPAGTPFLCLKMLRFALCVRSCLVGRIMFGTTSSRGCCRSAGYKDGQSGKVWEIEHMYVYSFSEVSCRFASIVSRLDRSAILSMKTPHSISSPPLLSRLRARRRWRRGPPLHTRLLSSRCLLHILMRALAWLLMVHASLTAH